jgi:hypothetical protein
VIGVARGGPIRSHHTETVDKSWAGSRAQTKLGDDPRALRAAHAWVDPDDDAGNKSAYKFIHHEVGRGGVGAANVKACTSGIGVLNGGRGGSDIPASDRAGVYRHLATHLRDAGREPPPLKR